jgi:hypothetical protein
LEKKINEREYLEREVLEGGMSWRRMSWRRMSWRRMSWRRMSWRGTYRYWMGGLWGERGDRAGGVGGVSEKGWFQR